MTARFGPDEAAEYYYTYISQVPDGDIREVLDAQLGETLRLLKSIPESKADHRYAPDKWTIREVVAHVSDTERVFAFRAFWFGRGFTGEMPSFDQNVAMSGANAGARTLASHADEFRAVREASLALFRNFSPEAWSRRGFASGHSVSVRALAHIAAGHVAHHVRILNERYL